MGGTTLFSGGSNEPYDFKIKKKIYIYKIFFFVSLIL